MTFWGIRSRVLQFFAAAKDRLDEQVEERKYVRVAQAGGPDGRRAFAQLVRMHEGWLHTLLFALLGSQADAEDVAQAAFLKAYKALPGFRSEARFGSWLRRIALNEAYNVRGRRREFVTTTGDPFEIPTEDLGPRSIEERQVILQVLDKLTYSYREVLVLRYVECLDLEAIAAHLGLGKPATKMRIRRARDQFEAAYAELIGEAA